jgi:hypothetical protein
MVLVVERDLCSIHKACPGYRSNRGMPVMFYFAFAPDKRSLGLFTRTSLNSRELLTAWPGVAPDRIAIEPGLVGYSQVPTRPNSGPVTRL